ncbi:ScbA/BarX family gamma-butyrolactone biosynthesis protein [Streptomyces sp. NBC_00638]|uniref:ScbA/BarX family gamma-butyrolactone biosynthesis protein n=1 Tax=unclassified Streptomyces TaxID=2593676 RepID=UPI00225A58E3|nr:ScbA/BarX family gamma-butyrolactone biosynthesis protein [Streptomyces sp. NBC_00638]MCX5008378.1 ScbA/BarX family gamma-butyrolactone biosynthesis protein [Streptomyces sp. NBC_00638]
MQAIVICTENRRDSGRAETDISLDIPFHPVSKELVHRTNPSDVLPAGWRPLTKDRFLISVAWPQDHPFYTRVHGNHAANLIGETIRQCGLLLAHAAYDVPLGHHFVMWDMTYTREAARPAAHPGTHHIEVEVHCSDLRFRGSRLGAMTCEMTLRADGRTVAQGGGRFDIVSPAAYRRLRGDQIEAGTQPVQPDSVPPAAVGRTRAIDVLLAPAPEPAPATDAPSGRWRLRADFGHPTLFDHRNDHYPGMVLVEAAFQAANATIAPALHHHTSAKIAFLGYVEYGEPCWIETRVQPTGSPHVTAIEVTGRQSDRLMFTALLEGTSAQR